MSRRVGLISVVLSLTAAAAGSARGDSAPDFGRPFDPSPASQPLYGVSPPSDDPANRVHRVVADDGTTIYVESWLPAANAGHVPSTKMPTVLLYTPYSAVGQPSLYVDLLVPRGYAVAQAHLRGFGGSGGCPDFFSPKETEDGALVVEYLGRDAIWSDGNIGMIGLSYEAGSQLATATAPSGRQYPWLKAIVPFAPLPSVYDIFHYDGVPQFMKAPGFQAFYVAVWLGISGPPGPALLPDRISCEPEPFLWALDTSGDFAGEFALRDVRPRLSSLRAAMLTTFGHRDGRHPSKVVDGFFNRLPPGVPRAGLFGVWRHGGTDTLPMDPSFDPTDGPPRTDWWRSDIAETVVAWLDHWVKGIDTGADGWPLAQVQDTTGQWRAVTNWPHPDGTPGRLALSAGSVLGASAPSGSSSFLEGGFELRDSTYLPGTAAVFETAPLVEPLELLGMPIADLWLTTNRPDGHVTAKLEVIGPDGTITMPEARTEGARSLRHLDPLEGGSDFRQGEGRPAQVGEPLNVPIRLNATALVVPAGGRLRLTIAGSVNGWDGINFLRQAAQVAVPDTVGGPTQPSGSFSTITVLHDCAHPSMLRFITRDEPADWLDVREFDQSGPLGVAAGAPPPVAHGGGLALSPICGLLS